MNDQSYSPLQPSYLDRLIVGVLLGATIMTGTAALYTLNRSFLTTLPRTGGSHTEGIVGTPRFINPLLAVSNADHDLTSLIYAGLMNRDEHGVLIPELAEGYTLSEDKRTYTFTLKEGLTFHDGTPLTADDVVYTVSLAADPLLHSPAYVHWEGVTAEAVDARTVTFTLPQPYAPFIENTTLGILPKHIWGTLAPSELPFSDYNMRPVGAGPYELTELTRDKSGIPAAYLLTAFDAYALGTPHIETFTLNLYRTNTDALDAYRAGTIDAVSTIDPTTLAQLITEGVIRTDEVRTTPYLREYAVFLNQNKAPVLLHEEVREALTRTAPRKAIIDQVLSGYGTPLESTVPEHALHADHIESTSTTSPTTGSIEDARTLLENAGWKRRASDNIYVLERKEGTEELHFTLTTVNVPELRATAELLASTWRELGASVEVETYELADLTQSIIRPRRYDTLLFGMVTGYELDLYAFWHSSQRNDPGLNIAQYADLESDALLEQARIESDENKRAALYTEFAQRVTDQHAAIMLYAPHLTYLVRGSVQHITLHPVSEPSDRFDTVHTWYVETDHVWPFIRALYD